MALLVLQFFFIVFAIYYTVVDYKTV